MTPPLFDTSEENPKFSDAVTAEEKEEVRWSIRTDSIRAAIGPITPGRSTHFVTAGTWSMYELLDYVIRQTGPAYVDAFTWNLSLSAVRRFIKLKDDGLLLRLRLLCNSVMHRFVAEAIAVLQQHAETLILYPNHAKGFLLKNDRFTVSVVSSANFSNNTNIEAGVLSTDPAVYEMHERWITPLFERRELLASNTIHPINLKEQPPDHSRTLYLVRGLPGSGKSLLAHAITDAVFENDDFFTGPTGEYHFDCTRMPQARAQCYNGVKMAMENAVEKIAVANVFADPSEMSDYFKAAEDYGYRVQTVIVENRRQSQNIHGVESDAIEKMRKRFKVQL